MNPFMSRTIIVLAFLVSPLLAPLSHATWITYSYEGPDFDNPSPLLSPYESGDHVEGYVTIDDAFLDSSGTGLLDGYWTDPPAWLIDVSFTDGVQTRTRENVNRWEVTLAIREYEKIAWFIRLGTLSTIGFLVYLETICGDPWDALDNDADECGGSESYFSDYGRVPINYPEQCADILCELQDAYTETYLGDGWTASAIPEPHILALLSSALVVSGFARRRINRGTGFNN